MKIVFIGGGSYAMLPIARGLLQYPELLGDGEIALYDTSSDRAEAMGRMIMKTPEFASVPCRVSWGQPIEELLDGADIVNARFPCGSLQAGWKSSQVSEKYGFIHSDQLSPTGAFLSLCGGPIILDYARKMERYCPQAWFLIFSNPVAVYSALVNNYTKIRALGVCGGHANHQWDLTRLLGADALHDDYDVDVAGVNHLSFILRGTVGGRDLYHSLEQSINRVDWKPPTLLPRWDHQAANIFQGLERMIDTYRKFGVTIFSTEGDGVAHLYYQEETEQARQRSSEEWSTEHLQAWVEQIHTQRAQADLEFRAKLNIVSDADFWSRQTDNAGMFGRDDSSVIIRIAKALGGLGTEKVAVSFPNRGAVEGFAARTVLEYSQNISNDGRQPVANLAVPAPLHGLITSLATHQTLLADAIATEDPLTLFHALYAYPMKQNTKDSRALFTELLDVFRSEIPAVFQETKRYLVNNLGKSIVNNAAI